MNFFIKNTIIVACAICGVLCISLPIPIIVNNFNKFYEKAKIEEEIEAKRKKTSWEDAKRGNKHVSFARLIEGFILFLFHQYFFIYLQHTHTFPHIHNRKSSNSLFFLLFMFLSVSLKKKKRKI